MIINFNNMSNIDDIEKKKREIYELCIDYNNYEKFIKESQTNEQNYENIGYLIENDLIIQYENSIFYNGLRPILCNGYNNCAKLLGVNYKDFKEFYVSQKKFDKKENLKESLKNNKYKLITSELWKKISRSTIKNEDGIKYKIANKIISIIFNVNEKLDFVIDNFIISESTLIKNDTYSINNNKEKSENNGDEIVDTESFKNINTNKEEKNITSNNNPEEITTKGETKQNENSDINIINEHNDDKMKNSLELNINKEIEIILLIYKFQKKLIIYFI